MHRAGNNTFVVWFQLGELRRWEPGPISDSGRPLPFVGEAVGVLFMRSGDTCSHACECAIQENDDENDSGTYRFIARHVCCDAPAVYAGRLFASRNVVEEWGGSLEEYPHALNR
jgi:hypothetical protein